MMVRNSSVLRSRHDQPWSLEASASGWGSSASTSVPSSSTSPLSHIGTRWSRRRKHLCVSKSSCMIDFSEKYFPFLSSSEAGWIFYWFCDQHNDWGCYNLHWGEHWWSSWTGGQAKRFSGSMPGVFYKAPNHIALSMPDNKIISWHCCDALRGRQTTPTREYWLTWFNIYRGVLCTRCEPPSQSRGWHWPHNLCNGHYFDRWL